MSRYYIAYGSDIATKQMKKRNIDAHIFGKTLLHDHELLFRQYQGEAVLTIQPCIGKEVPIAVWEVNRRIEKIIDAYKGYPQIREKKDYTLYYYANPLGAGEIKDGESLCKELDGFYYVVPERYPLMIPSAEYEDICKKRYEELHIDTHYIDEAIERTEELMKSL